MENIDQLEAVADIITKKDHIVFLTGAGISTPSGIPDFRSPGGFWEKYDPEEYATMKAFLENPDKIWKMFWDALKIRKKAKPNPAHKAITIIEKEREKIGKQTVVITQNVDSLHQAAGTTNVIELHGTARRARCIACKSSYYIEYLEQNKKRKKAPKCDFCGAPLKLDVTLFGEFIDPYVLEKIKKELRKTSAIIAAGTSLEVYPASEFFITSRATKIFINNQKPEKDIKTDYELIGKIEKILPIIANKVRQKVSNKN